MPVSALYWMPSGVSPSSRRAWIEIIYNDHNARIKEVALLAEGVDRNITFSIGLNRTQVVALLAEGVDRNPALLPNPPQGFCRPPRGGRG